MDTAPSRLWGTHERKVSLTAAFLVVLCLVIFVAETLIHETRQDAEAKLVALWQSEIRLHLRPGTSAKDCVAFLEARRIDDGDYSKSDHRIYGIIPNTSRTFFTTGSVQVTLELDKQDRFVKGDVRAVYTGP